VSSHDRSREAAVTPLNPLSAALTELVHGLTGADGTAAQSAAPETQNADRHRHSSTTQSWRRAG
jgi:hypothetical protein